MKTEARVSVRSCKLIMLPHNRLHHKRVTASVHSPGKEVRVWDCPHTEEEESVGLVAVRVPTLIISK